MIPNATDLVDIQSNITGETGQFTVDENSLTKIMSVLTNLYSDPEMAVCREYLTNALDAQIEAQENDPNYVWRPIEVTTPSHFNKTYIVRDFGTGMNGNDLKEIYSKYGKSTKETSQSVTGMLGLGSKCALTYTGQFTITGYKNGVKTVAIVSKDENDIPVFMIVDTSATTEPNGVEISVPVRDRNSFATKTKQFLQFWKDGQVLVDGVEPVKHGHKLVKTMPLVRGNISGTVEVHFIEDGNRYEPPTSYVVMGNVPYAVDPEQVDSSLREANMGYVAYVPMGAVDFPPSREVLQYNKATREVVKKISEGLFDLVFEDKVKDIVNAPDHKTAYERFRALPNVFARHRKANDLRYKGEPFISQFAHDHMRLSWDYQERGQISERRMVNLAQSMEKCLVVTGVTMTTKPTSYFKKKVKHYMTTNGIGAYYADQTAILTEKDIVNPWIAHLPRIDADTIKAIKLPRAAGGNTGPRVETPFDFYYMDNGKATCNSEVKINCPAGKKLVYISPQDMRETYRKQGCNAQDLVRNLGDDVYLVVMGKNRFEKFLRTHPGAITVKAFATAKVNALVAAATDAEYIVAELDTYGEKPFLEKVNIPALHDPDLRDIATLVQSKTTATHFQQARNLVQFLRRADIHMTEPTKKVVKNTVSDRYPLIKDSSAGRRHTEHLVYYINAVYQAKYAPKS